MTRIVVLGSTGMLGSAVVRQARKSNLTCLEVSRSTGFDYPKDDLGELFKKLDINETDWVVNCIGWIPQKSLGDLEQDTRDANLLNVSLIQEISNLQRGLKFKWIQILTDCVFSGSTGGYTESSPMNATDLYGTTKIAGELHMGNAIRIRCSIVGKDHSSHKSLFEWFRSKAANQSQITGYTNSFWNGVSAEAFAKLPIGLAKQNVSEAIRQHWIPANSVTKFELLKIFAKNLKLNGIEIVPGTGAHRNMTLATENEPKNQQLWAIAGYPEPPTIEFLCEEFILEGS